MRDGRVDEEADLCGEAAVVRMQRVCVDDLRAVMGQDTDKFA